MRRSSRTSGRCERRRSQSEPTVRCEQSRVGMVATCRLSSGEPSFAQPYLSYLFPSSPTPPNPNTSSSTMLSRSFSLSSFTSRSRSLSAASFRFSPRCVATSATTSPPAWQPTNAAAKPNHQSSSQTSQLADLADEANVDNAAARGKRICTVSSSSFCTHLIRF